MINQQGAQNCQAYYKPFWPPSWHSHNVNFFLKFYKKVAFNQQSIDFFKRVFPFSFILQQASKMYRLLSSKKCYKISNLCLFIITHPEASGLGDTGMVRVKIVWIPTHLGLNLVSDFVLVSQVSCCYVVTIRCSQTLFIGSSECEIMAGSCSSSAYLFHQPFHLPFHLILIWNYPQDAYMKSSTKTTLILISDLWPSRTKIDTLFTLYKIT